MMGHMRCTWSQLQQEPFEELLVFRAFMAGEADAQRMKEA